jgi:hypothetical protein
MRLELWLLVGRIGLRLVEAADRRLNPEYQVTARAASSWGLPEDRTQTPRKMTEDERRATLEAIVVRKGAGRG